MITAECVRNSKRSSCGCSSNVAVLARIIGGEEVLSHSWGWMVGLYRSNSYFCGGSLIESDLIITAAHCMKPELTTLANIKVIAGSNSLSNRDGQGQIRHVHEVFVHPDFDNNLKVNDIAIIRLSSPFDISISKIATICLPAAVTLESIAKLEYPVPGTALVVIGWGVISTSNPNPSTSLQQVTVQAVESTSSDCKTHAQEMANVTLQFCAGVSGGGKDSCQGDSGSPIMAFFGNRWYIMGITSIGYGCALPGHPGIYTRLAYYIPFIETIKNKNQTIFSSVFASTPNNSMSILSPIHESESGDDNEEVARPAELIEHISNDNIEKEPSDKFINENNFHEIKRSVVVNENQPLARCSVLYLGTAIPTPNQQGIDSIQEPLSKRYPIDGSAFVQGAEAWLSIDENGLQIQFLSDPSHLLYYPIRSLVYCASVRFVERSETRDKYSHDWRFVPLDYPEASYIENTHNPPLFVANFQRTRLLPTDECHCFVIKTVQTAVTLVQACSSAYGIADSEQDCSKVPIYFEIKDGGSKIQEVDNEFYLTPAFDEEENLNYQIDNDCTGFFYVTHQISIGFWQLWEPSKQDHNRPLSRLSNKSLSSNSSHRSSHHRRRASIKSNNPDIQQPLSQYQTPTQTPVKEPLESVIDPYAHDPNVVRVESVKDMSTGRDVFIRWLRNTSETTEQVSVNQKPAYDFHVDFNTEYPDHQSDRKLSNQMKNLSVSDDDFKNLLMIYNKYQSMTTDHEEKKTKKKHRKHKHQNHEVISESSEDHHKTKSSNKTHKKHRHKNRETTETSAPQLLRQNFSASSFSMTYPYDTSVSFNTLPSYSQSNLMYETPPYWPI
ncbi:unnamed protein product [Rotaria magnacalcarata]